MSTETFVNRVPDTLGLKIETERLKQEGIPASTPVHYQGKPTTVGQLPEGSVPDETVKEILINNTDQAYLAPAQTAEAIRAAQTGKIELELQQAGVETDVESAAKDELQKSAKVLLSLFGQDEFKKQVIAAFKHLGLDTRKHFGV